MVKSLPEFSGFRPPASGGEARACARENLNRGSRERKRLGHADFQRVYQQGRRHFATHMTVFYLARDWGQGARVGLTVGRVLGGSVERNRIKRRLREAVRVGAPVVEAPVDVVINPRKSVLTVDFAVLRTEVGQAFEKIRSSLAGRQSRQTQVAGGGARGEQK